MCAPGEHIALTTNTLPREAAQVSELTLWVPVTDGTIANAATGEALDLGLAEWPQLAHARRSVIDVRYALNDAARLIDGEVARRLDIANERHIEVDGLRLEVNAPRVNEWDTAKLQEVLAALVGEGRLGAGVPPRCVKTKVTYTPVASELRKLLGHEDPRVRELIGQCRAEVPQERRVSVK